MAREMRAPYARMACALEQAETIAICGHVNPDGDCIGSQLALQLALESKGKRVTGLLVEDARIDTALRFLPLSDKLVAATQVAAKGEHFDAFVAVDVPTEERLGADAARIMAESGMPMLLDHHASDAPLASLRIVDPNAPSTTMLVWQLLDAMGCQEVPGVAECCLTGLITDTGCFQFQNTTAEAFSAAAEMVLAGADPNRISREVFQSRSQASLALEGLVISRLVLSQDGACAVSWLEAADFARTGADKSDAEPLVNTLRSIAGVRVACLLREQEDGIRVRLRAKDDTDVSTIARTFNGGGHRAAAGFTCHAPMRDAIDLVMCAMCEALAAQDLNAATCEPHRKVVQ